MLFLCFQSDIFLMNELTIRMLWDIFFLSRKEVVNQDYKIIRILKKSVSEGRRYKTGPSSDQNIFFWLGHYYFFGNKKR